MSLTVVVGGQYGSEGKGKMVSHLVCNEPGEVAVVRCGGSNAGHTAEGRGRRFLLRQLPSGAVDARCKLYLAAGMQIDLSLLLDEIDRAGVTPDRLGIDPNATLIEAHDSAAERAADLGHRIGSTETGTGAAIVHKIMRAPTVRCASDVHELEPFLTDVSAALLATLDRGGRVIVEGTQGFGLSLHHGTYPYVTGRDTTAAGFLSEAGLPPTRVDDVILVLRTYPIRVAGNSGPMHNELSWDEVARRAGYPTALAEYTTVTGRLRRVGEFDWGLARRAAEVNGATVIALHGLDYIDYSNLGATAWARVSSAGKRFVADLEQKFEICVPWLFTGPSGRELVERSDSSGFVRSKRVAVHSG